MESLFKLTELESRFPLNMNVLSRGKVPNVLSLKRRAAGMARPPQGRAGPPLAAPAGRDRAAAGNPRRLPDRLSQHRRGDPHHPRGGRAEAGDDGALVADRHAGRSDPQHAAARLAQARGDSRSARSSTGCRPRRSEIEALLASDAKQWKTIAWEIGEVQQEVRPGHRRSASAAPPSPMRRSTTSPTSSRR